MFSRDIDSRHPIIRCLQEEFVPLMKMSYVVCTLIYCGLPHPISHCHMRVEFCDRCMGLCYGFHSTILEICNAGGSSQTMVVVWWAMTLGGTALHPNQIECNVSQLNITVQSYWIIAVSKYQCDRTIAIIQNKWLLFPNGDQRIMESRLNHRMWNATHGKTKWSTIVWCAFRKGQGHCRTLKGSAFNNK